MCSETSVGVLTDVDMVNGVLDETEKEMLIARQGEARGRKQRQRGRESRQVFVEQRRAAVARDPKSRQQKRDVKVPSMDVTV